MASHTAKPPPTRNGDIFYNQPRAVQIVEFRKPLQAVAAAAPTSGGSTTTSNGVVKNLAQQADQLNVDAAADRRPQFRYKNQVLQRILCHESVRDLKVVVICVAGPFRSGKSFLLNFLLRYLNRLPAAATSVGDDDDDGVLWEVKDGNASLTASEWLGDARLDDGFDWRGGSESHTEGIWTWSRAIRVRRGGSDYAILLLDTQGAFDMKSSVHETSLMFALSNLLSSVLIYNIRGGQIGSDTLQQLHFFVEYGRRASEAAKGDGSGTVLRPLQSLILQVRDWQSPAEHAYGADGGETYLNKRLNINEAGSEYAPETLEVCKQLRGCFENIQCFLMPHPGQCVAESDFCGELKAMSPKFVQHMSQFVIGLFEASMTKAKRVGNVQMTCAKLAEFTPQCADRLADQRGMPTAASWVDAFSQSINTMAVDAALDAHDKHMRLLEKTNAAGSAMSSGVFQELCHAAREVAFGEYERHNKWGSTAAIAESKTKLRQALDERKRHYQMISVGRPNVLADIARLTREISNVRQRRNVTTLKLMLVKERADKEIAELKRKIAKEVNERNFAEFLEHFSKLEDEIRKLQDKFDDRWCSIL